MKYFEMNFTWPLSFGTFHRKTKHPLIFFKNLEFMNWTNLLPGNKFADFLCYFSFLLQLFQLFIQPDRWRNEILRHSLRGEVNWFSLQYFIAAYLNLMPILSSLLEIIACLHSRGTRKAIRAIISMREDKQGIKFKEGAINCCYENNN